jgi:integrase
MAKVVERHWVTRAGEQRSAWAADYFSPDANGKMKRRLKTFHLKRDAQRWLDQTQVDVRRGVHTPVNESITVREAAKLWIDHVKAEGREKSTIAHYEQHAYLHIIPRIGHLKLASLTTPGIERFRDDLLGRISRPLAKKVLTSLKSLLRDQCRRGGLAQNVAAVVKITLASRDQRKLTVGVDIPTPQEVKAIIDACTSEQSRATAMVAALAGLRASELRGLRWADIDMKSSRPTITVKQRADRYNAIGSTKSETSARVIPIGPMLVNTLRQWKWQCPKGEADLVFPNAHGRVEHHKNMSRAVVERPGVKAGLVDDAGKPRYGLHSLRHYYASWCINRRADGGLELPLKVVSYRLGHSGIQITADRYGHLFPNGDDGKELAAGERAMFATN